MEARVDFSPKTKRQKARAIHRFTFSILSARKFSYSGSVVTLSKSKVFSQLSASDLTALEKIATERRFDPGQEIFKEGDVGDGLYCLKEGLVEISGNMEENSRQVFSRIKIGDIFGEMAVFEDKPRSASAVARNRSVVYFVGRDQMLELVSHSPALAMLILREISNRLREFNGQYLRDVLQAERLAVIGRFARSIIHDLKNPLNIIGLTAEVVNAPAVSATIRDQAANTIRKQVDRINDLVGEILDFTQGSQSAVVLAPTSYRWFLQKLLAELQPEAELKSTMIELENEPPDVPLLMDPRRLRRVFCNLVSNATDAMPQGGKITMRFALSPKELVTEIQDSGPGIAPQISGQLFEAFVTHGKENGTGLGLSISKRIIEDHHGWISARNAADKGAIFAFGLPRPLA